MLLLTIADVLQRGQKVQITHNAQCNAQVHEQQNVYQHTSVVSNLTLKCELRLLRTRTYIIRHEIHNYCSIRGIFGSFTLLWASWKRCIFLIDYYIRNLRRLWD